LQIAAWLPDRWTLNQMATLANLQAGTEAAS
jgi:hypothetical protein